MLSVRQETVDDVDDVARLHVNAWRAGYAGIVPAEVLDGLDARAWADIRRDRYAADGPRPFNTLVAQADDGTIVGFVTLGPYRRNRDLADLDPRFGEILACYVDPAHWGSGVGHTLMVAAVAELSRRGASELRLWVLEDNARARRFYERHGLFADGHRGEFSLGRFDRPDVSRSEVRYSLRLRKRRR